MVIELLTNSLLTFSLKLNIYFLLNSHLAGILERRALRVNERVPCNDIISGTFTALAGYYICRGKLGDVPEAVEREKAEILLRRQR